MSVRQILLEYFNPTVPDANVGGGVGTLKPKGLGSQYKFPSTYPYVEEPEEITDEEEEDLYSLTFGSDVKNIDKLLRKFNPDYVAVDPGGAGVGKRYDMSGMGYNQRIDLAEDVSMRRGDSMHGSMSPIPFKSLYRKFSGPAIGGFSVDSSYTTGPYGPSGKRTGTEYGFSRAPLTDEDDGTRVYSIKDIMSPDDRSVLKARRNKSVSKNYKSS